LRRVTAGERLLRGIMTLKISAAPRHEENEKRGYHSGGPAQASPPLFIVYQLA
jgi:hypothetical protein